MEPASVCDAGVIPMAGVAPPVDVMGSAPVTLVTVPVTGFAFRIALMKLVMMVAVVPSSMTVAPVSCTMNCAIIAAMRLACRKVLLTAADEAVPVTKPVAVAEAAA